jgi:acyl dehydratase
MVGGMALGATMEAAAAPRQPATIIENVSPPGMVPIGTTVSMLPAGAFSTQVNGTDYYYYNGTYYRPVFSGSQVVYVASAI